MTKDSGVFFLLLLSSGCGWLCGGMEEEEEEQGSRWTSIGLGLAGQLQPGLEILKMVA